MKRFGLMALAVSLLVGVVSMPTNAAELQDNIEVEEKEYFAGNNIATATELVWDTEINGSITANNTVDVYKFSITEPSTVTFEVFAEIERYYEYTLYDENGVKLRTNQVYWDSSSKSSYQSIVTGLNTGNYYLFIQECSYYAGYGDYRLKATFKSIEDDFKEIHGGNNDTRDTASEISLGRDYKGLISEYDGDEVDYLKFTMDDSGLLGVNLFTSYWSSWGIMNENGKKLYSYNSGYTDNSVEYNKELALDSGVYYLYISTYDDYQITYKFNLYGIRYEMYRLYNPNSGEHFYTANSNERDVLSQSGWNYEGVAWVAPGYSNVPVYRLYNKNSGEHHYTTNEAEKDALVKLKWKYEGIGWYSTASTAKPLYRLYNPNATGAQEAGAHHYTMDAAERDMLVSVGWNNEGIGWYGL